LVLLIAFFDNVLGAPPSLAPRPAPHSPPGQGDNDNPYCHNVERIVLEDQCEPYVEKTCWTTNQELCEPKQYENCTGKIETTVEKECFDVSELVCDMVESINYETLEETYQVQRCYNGKDRVCDTTHKIDMTSKEDYQCTNVESPNCYMEEKTINDVTCTKTVEFDCKKEIPAEDDDSYPTPVEVVCDRKPKEDCYEIPRKIQVEVCKTDVSRFCDKFTNVFPFTTKEQKCHFEPKKICQLDMKTRPKKAKKYTYEKQCKEEPRQICDEVEKKAMKTECELQERMSCSYLPVEQCNTEDKEYCHKVEKVKVEEVCDSRHATSIYHHPQRQDYY